MLESIGNTIAAALSNLPFVSRSGGLTELVDVQNGENRQRIPGAKGYRETDGAFTGKPEDIASMAPDGSETCIAFVDVPSDIQVDETHRIYSILNVRFRVVVWFDERKIDFEGENDKPGRLTQEIINAVKGLNFTVFKKHRTTFESISVDAGRIWSAYNFKPDDALFMAPYRTFAVTFRMKAWYFPACDVPTIETKDVCY